MSANAVTATIPAGGFETPPIDLELARAHRLEMPDDGWTAASITFRVSHNGVDFDDLFVETGEYVLTAVAAGRAILLDQAAFYGIRRLIIRSGTAAAPVNQAADRSIAVVKAPR